MSEEKSKFESGLIGKYGAGCVASIPVKNGAAYFRQPTAEEWEEMQALRENPDGTTNRQAYYRLIQKCFAGAWVNDALSSDTLEAIAAKEGPAFMGGPAGSVVNKLAGTGERQTTFLGECG